MLDVGDGHEHLLRGMRQPATASRRCIVHGGPGGGSNPDHAPLPRSRAITASSCSISAAAGARRRNASLEANTTWHLVADMERLREHSASSAGSCSAARGARRWRSPMPRRTPSASRALILRGIFLLRRAELEWFYQEGCSWIFPEAFAAYQSRHPAGRARRHDRRLSQARSRIPIPQVRLAAAKAWSVWEGSTLSLLQDAERIRQLRRRRLCARLRAHRVPLLRQRRLLRQPTASCCATPAASRDIPGIIVHGRYDVVTPVKNAWDLKARLADRRSAHRRRCRPRHERAGHRARADRGHAPLSAAPRRPPKPPQRAEVVQHDLAAVRPVAVLDDVDALPGAEQHRARPAPGSTATSPSAPT